MTRLLRLKMQFLEIPHVLGLRFVIKEMLK